MNKRKGFTLIELLAVIVILGLLMAIAIPSVTKYITESRKKTLTTTLGNYIGALVNDVNDLSYTFTGTNTIYAVPIECISLERGGTSPFGEWYQANDNYFAYVLVQYDDVNSKYVYGFTFKDSAGYGLYPTIQGNIKEKGSQIKTGLDIKRPKTGDLTSLVSLAKWQESGFKVDSMTDFQVLEAALEGEIGDGKTTCTLCQKGKNYEQVEQEKNDIENDNLIASNKYIFLDDNKQYILLNDENAENGIELYNNDSLVGSIPNSLITRNGNNITITNTGAYDGTYTIYDDGYIEMNGTPVAKSASKWVNRDEDYFFIIHNGVIYSSSDGNNFGEEVVKFGDINFVLHKYLVSSDSPFEFDKFKGYSFASYDSQKLTYENFYDFLHLLNYENRCASNLRVCDFYFQYENTGNYPFWGGTAYDKKKNNALITYADWDSSKITLEKSQTLYIIKNNVRNNVSLSSKINDGTFVLSEEEKYFYKNNVQKDIIFIDDYPFAYEKGMTWKEWIHSEYDGSGLLDDVYGDTYIYIPKEYLDSNVESGHAMGIGSLVSVLYLNNYGSDPISFDYCYGDVKLPVIKEEDYYKYGYDSSTHKFVGWQWEGGLIKDSFLSYEFFNYYIEGKNQPIKGFSAHANAVFEKK